MDVPLDVPPSSPCSPLFCTVVPSLPKDPGTWIWLCDTTHTTFTSRSCLLPATYIPSQSTGDVGNMSGFDFPFPELPAISNFRQVVTPGVASLHLTCSTLNARRSTFDVDPCDFAHFSIFYPTLHPLPMSPCPNMPPSSPAYQTYHSSPLNTPGASPSLNSNLSSVPVSSITMASPLAPGHCASLLAGPVPAVFGPPPSLVYAHCCSWCLV